MALVDAEDFAERETERVYLAARLAEAERVERTLSEHGVDYAVEVERYRGRFLGFLPTEYDGAAFYVLAGQAEFCRGILRAAGLEAGLMQADRG